MLKLIYKVESWLKQMHQELQSMKYLILGPLALAQPLLLNVCLKL